MTNHRFCTTTQKRTSLLIAPADADLDAFQGPVTRSQSRHDNLIGQIQRLRGAMYSEDGAISPSSLSADGRHISPVDESSWHLVTLTQDGDVLGCMRFRQHRRSADFHDLCLHNSGLAQSKIWGSKLRASVFADMDAAHKIGFTYVEIGGWALAHELRGTVEALQSVLAIFAWSQALGGAIGVSTATERHGSAQILRRLGGKPMQWDGCALPAYYDEHYKCGMEVLRFDSRMPSPRYAGIVEQLRDRISCLEIVQGTHTARLASKIPLSLPSLFPQNWAGSLAFAC